MSQMEIDLTPSPRLLEVLGDIPYEPWQCLAELIDNAFDDFARRDWGSSREPPVVRVTVPKRAQARTPEAFVSVCDNGSGMTVEQFEKALRAGYSGNVRHGSLGLFGMGFNIATARLGHITEVRTTREGDEHWAVVRIDARDMAKRESFRAPLRFDRKEDAGVHGTEVTVRELRPEGRSAFDRPNAVKTIIERLGNVYSYLLRQKSPIQGLDGQFAVSQGYSILVNGQKVKARLPCVWSASRYVTTGGVEIAAVHPIDIPLPRALACLSCGHWHRETFDEEKCIECGGEALEEQDRAIHGWVGIQRYLHGAAFGIDFLRNGRKILLDDRSVFQWENPDTGERVIEYPTSVPNKGRIVGEIHLDHCPVNYQKNDFERNSPQWHSAIRLIRGDGPLRPGYAKDLHYDINDTPIGRLVRGYHETRPGLRWLIPGNGRTAIHEKAQEWAAAFHRGIPEYLTDDRWYEAAQTHDEIASGARPEPTPNDDLDDRTGLTPTTDPDGERPPENGGPEDRDEPAPPETEEQRFQRYRRAARPMLDLSGEVSVAHLARRSVSVFDTSESLSERDRVDLPAITRMSTGGAIEVYVNGAHEVFTEYGRDPRDYAIAAIAEALRASAGSNDRLTSVIAEVTRQFPDQRMTDAALRERADGLLTRIRELLPSALSGVEADAWAVLSPTCREGAEKSAALAAPSLDWRDATRDGRFIEYLGYRAVAELTRALPARILDGRVFRTRWSAWSEDQATLAAARVARLLDSLAEFLDAPGRRQPLDLRAARLDLDRVDDDVVMEATEFVGGRL